MTGLEELLERAAEGEPVGFGAEDVRRRVRRRSRVRRTGTAVLAVPLLVGGAIWGAAAVTDEPPDQLDVVDEAGGALIDGGLEGRWMPTAYSAVTVGSSPGYLEFGRDGLLRGDDGCNVFSAPWSVVGGRLLVGDIESTAQDCGPGTDTMMIEILSDDPTIGPSELGLGPLELRSERGFVAFVRADPDPAATVSPTTDQTPSRGETTTTIASTADVPAHWIGHDRDHRLVVVDTASGDVVRVLATFDDPDDFTEETGEPTAAGSFLGDIAVSPDGSTVYWELCCEPAPGVIFRASIDGGEPEQVTFGAFPAVSPDGSRLAVVELQWITIVELSSGETRRFMAGGGDGPSALANPAWSPDGRSIAFEQYDDDSEVGRIVVLDLEQADSLDDARPVSVADVTGTPMLPTFDRAGRLHLVRQQRASNLLTGGQDGPAEAVVIDADTGAVISQRALETAVSEQDHDSSGTYLIHTFVDGSVENRTLDGAPVALGATYLAAAW